MVDLQSMMDLRGAGEAHSELCRMGHPTELPRFPGLIEYQVSMRGPRGGDATYEVMAESLADAIRQAREMAFQFEPFDVFYALDDLEDIKITRVCAYD